MVQFAVDKIADENGDPLASDDDLFAIDEPAMAQPVIRHQHQS